VGYRIRILGTKLNPAPLEELRKLALPALLEADERVGDEWEALTLKHPSGVPIALIEKDLVVSGELGGEELNEFIDGVSYYKPDSAVAWLKEYLPKVKVIYSFQLLSGTEIDDGFDLMHRVYGGVWRHAGGILQADQEGFSDEHGYTILWQFDDHVSGSWNAGVLGKDGQWIHFEIDLGNEEHRSAFWRGNVPEGAKLLSDGAITM
jgi:hypothetical protein